MKNNLLLILFVITKLLIHCWIPVEGFELHRDEFLHLDQAHHLDWGFLSIPPVTSWISWVILQLGNSVFWIKFFPALFGALTLVFVWKTIEVLRGGVFACILGGMAVLFSALARTNTLYQPNSFDILCWTAFFYCLICYIDSNKSKWLYWGAVIVAFGFLNKYTVCFLMAGFLIALLVSRQRILFKQAVFYRAIGILLLLILPNLLWQYAHDFPVITHMQELTGRQLVHVDRMAFLKDQIIFFLPSFFVILLGMIGVIFYKPFIPYRIIGYNYLVTLLLFLYLQGKAYYAMGLYPVWVAFGSVLLEYLLQNGWRYYFRYVALGFVFIVGVLFIRATCPVFSPARIAEDPEVQAFYKETGQTVWEDGKDHGVPQDYADMIGWKELAGITGEALVSLNEQDRRSVFILCNDYGHAGAINYYLNPTPAAGSFSADYRNWFPKEAYELKALIWIGAKYENVENVFEGSGLPFSSVRIVGSIKNSLSREAGTTVYLLTLPVICFTTDDLYNWGEAGKSLY